MYTRDNYQKVKEMINSRREAAEAAADARRREVAMRSEEIARIDAELRSVGPKIFRAACRGEDLTKLREQNLASNKRRAELLVALGLPENYTDPQYTCKRCNDTGFTDDSRLCSCFKEALTLENIASSGIGKLIEKQSFDTFDLEWYRDDADTYARMKIVADNARAFARDFGKVTRDLLLIGKTGTGKTHISTAIAKEIVSKGFDVIYDSVQNIVSDFEYDKFKSGYSQSYEPKGEKYLECDLLIIDDLGTEFSSQFTVSCIYNLINSRKNRGLSTIISTNLSAEEFRTKYDDRISSRILGEYTVLPFGGRDHRIYS